MEYLTYPNVVAEALGSVGGPAWAEMSFEISRIMVEAKSRALKAEYSRELEQDLKSIHGLSADAVLSEVLSGEILIEQKQRRTQMTCFASFFIQRYLGYLVSCVSTIYQPPSICVNTPSGKTPSFSWYARSSSFGNQ